MAKGPTELEIMEALRQSGYLLEQDVANLFESLGYHVQPNRAFKDPEEGKSREIDVWAIHRKHHSPDAKNSFFVEFICECKNSQFPLVFFGRPLNQHDRERAPSEVILPFNEIDVTRQLADGRLVKALESAFHFFGLDKVHHYFRRGHKATQFCRIDRAGSGWSAQHGTVYDGIVQPVAKAVVARASEIRSFNTRNVWLLFPVVVTSAPIYFVDTAGAEPVLSEAPYVTLLRDLRTPWANGEFLVDFVPRSRLPEYLAQAVKPLVDRLYELCIDSHIPIFARKTATIDYAPSP